ncbi:MAG: hypothetical protein RIT44_127 [Pseudomonadota bacterium]
MNTKYQITAFTLVLFSLLAVAGPVHAVNDHKTVATNSAQDAKDVVQVMKKQFDQPQSPLKVAPVVVEADWALAGWLQDARGGRALLQKRHGQWVIVVCAGDGLREAQALIHTGMTADMAAALVKKLVAAESRLPAATLKKFASFEGMLRVDGAGAHGAQGAHGPHGAHGNQPASGAHHKP